MESYRTPNTATATTMVVDFDGDDVSAARAFVRRLMTSKHNQQQKEEEGRSVTGNIHSDPATDIATSFASGTDYYASASNQHPYHSEASLPAVTHRVDDDDADYYYNRYYNSHQYGHQSSFSEHQYQNAHHHSSRSVDENESDEGYGEQEGGINDSHQAHHRPMTIYEEILLEQQQQQMGRGQLKNEGTTSRANSQYRTNTTSARSIAGVGATTTTSGDVSKVSAATSAYLRDVRAGLMMASPSPSLAASSSSPPPRYDPNTIPEDADTDTTYHDGQHYQQFAFENGNRGNKNTVEAIRAERRAAAKEEWARNTTVPTSSSSSPRRGGAPTAVKKNNDGTEGTSNKKPFGKRVYFGNSASQQRPHSALSAAAAASYSYAAFVRNQTENNNGSNKTANIPTGKNDVAESSEPLPPPRNRSTTPSSNLPLLQVGSDKYWRDTLRQPTEITGLGGQGRHDERHSGVSGNMMMRSSSRNLSHSPRQQRSENSHYTTTAASASAASPSPSGRSYRYTQEKAEEENDEKSGNKETAREGLLDHIMGTASPTPTRTPPATAVAATVADENDEGNGSAQPLGTTSHYQANNNNDGANNNHSNDDDNDANNALLLRAQESGGPLGMSQTWVTSPIDAKPHYDYSSDDEEKDDEKDGGDGDQNNLPAGKNSFSSALAAELFGGGSGCEEKRAQQWGAPTVSAAVAEVATDTKKGTKQNISFSAQRGKKSPSPQQRQSDRLRSNSGSNGRKRSVFASDRSPSHDKYVTVYTAEVSGDEARNDNDGFNEDEEEVFAASISETRRLAAMMALERAAAVNGNANGGGGQRSGISRIPPPPPPGRAASGGGGSTPPPSKTNNNKNMMGSKQNPNLNSEHSSPSPIIINDRRRNNNRSASSAASPSAPNHRQHQKEYDDYPLHQNSAALEALKQQGLSEAVLGYQSNRGRGSISSSGNAVAAKSAKATVITQTQMRKALSATAASSQHVLVDGVVVAMSARERTRLRLDAERAERRRAQEEEAWQRREREEREAEAVRRELQAAEDERLFVLNRLMAEKASIAESMDALKTDMALKRTTIEMAQRQLERQRTMLSSMTTVTANHSAPAAARGDNDDDSTEVATDEGGATVAAAGRSSISHLMKGSPFAVGADGEDDYGVMNAGGDECNRYAMMTHINGVPLPPPPPPNPSPAVTTAVVNKNTAMSSPYYYQERPSEEGARPATPMITDASSSAAAAIDDNADATNANHVYEAQLYAQLYGRNV